MVQEPLRTRAPFTADHDVAHQIGGSYALLRWPLIERTDSPRDEGPPWRYIKTIPAAPWSIRVMSDGTVEQRSGFTQLELNEAEWVLYGGHRYWVDTESDLYADLVAAGFLFEEEV
jgi:hypothetical protein